MSLVLSALDRLGPFKPLPMLPLTLLTNLSMLLFSLSILFYFIVRALYLDTRNTHVRRSSPPGLDLLLVRLPFAYFALGHLFATGLGLFKCFARTVDGVDASYARQTNCIPFLPFGFLFVFFVVVGAAEI